MFAICKEGTGNYFSTDVDWESRFSLRASKKLQWFCKTDIVPSINQTAINRTVLDADAKPLTGLEF